MSRPVRLSVLWEDDAVTIRDFPSKAAAIDWLATNETERPMHSCHIEQLYVAHQPEDRSDRDSG